MKAILRLSIFIATAVTVSAAEPSQKFSGAPPFEWSVRMAKSEMARRGDSMFYPAPTARWDYTRGFLAQSLIKLGRRVDDPVMSAYGARIVESFITPEGGIATYKPQEYNLDMLPPGRALLLRYEETKDPAIAKAIRLLRHQLDEQPRTSDGGFWHKQRYPYQMWLDGLFMGSTFFAQYGQVFQEPAAIR